MEGLKKTTWQKEAFIRTWHKLERENSLRGFEHLFFTTDEHGNLLRVKTETPILEAHTFMILWKIAVYWNFEIKLTGNGIGVRVEFFKE